MWSVLRIFFLAKGDEADFASDCSERIYEKITLNNRAMMRPDTEQDIVLAPAAYWEHFLHPKLVDFWRKKNRLVRSEDTNVVVSVTQRKERDLKKRFDDH
jgi:pyridoxine/pyridoxamine 5'-phosphate oxidase